MKKLFSMILVIVLTLAAFPIVYASPVFTVQELPRDTEPLLPRVGKTQYSGYLFEFQGKSYVIGSKNYHYTLPQELGNSWGNKDAIWTGQYYMVRDPEQDGIWWNPDRYGIPVKFYDKDRNLVNQYKFPKHHVAAIGYYNNTYYCGLFRGISFPLIVMKSTDMQNWEETDEQLPRTVGDIIITDSAVAFPGMPLAPISYETDPEKQFSYTLGDWIVKRDNDWNFYLSNNNVYFVKLEFPKDFLSDFSEANNMKYYDVKCVYEYEEDIVVDMNKVDMYNENSPNIRLTVPKQDIYAELESQKTAPYIKLNGSILGFKQQPVVEQDRTLVPMRFLFEQMGADVDWDEATETAKVTQDGEEISFQIGNTTANVNGSMLLMDVPAKLENDKTMVPLRFLSENLGYSVEWNEATRMVTITTE